MPALRFRALLLLIAGLLLTSLSARSERPRAAFPQFRRHVIEAHFSGGYGIALADVDNDRRPDVIALGGRVVWYRNPDWQSRPIANTSGNICVVPRDIDGDGQVEMALAFDFSLGNSSAGGTVAILRRRADLNQKWDRQIIDHSPTTHRMKWGRDGALFGIPIIGKGSKRPYQDVPAKVVRYAPPQQAGGQWKPELVNDRLHVIHNGQLYDLNGDGEQELLLASSDGLYACWIMGRDVPSAQGGAPAWVSLRLGKGDESNPPPDSGCSEVAVGRLGKRRVGFIATIEPWHGDKVAVYRPEKKRPFPGRYRRTVIDAPGRAGHALAVADLNGDGRDDIVAGFRQPTNRLFIYECLNDRATRWRKHVIETEVAVQGVMIGDLNDDGRPDIAAIGGPRIRWYENRPAPPGT